MDATPSPEADLTSVMEAVRVRILPDGRMTAADAALYLGVELQTLATWRCLGKGPGTYTKIGGKVFYRQSDLDQFIESGVREVAVA